MSEEFTHNFVVRAANVLREDGMALASQLIFKYCESHNCSLKDHDRPEPTFNENNNFTTIYCRYIIKV